MYWFTKCLSQYADFSGRARRKEYWMFTLVNIIFSLVATLLDTLIGSQFPIFSGIYSLVIFIPSLAVIVRRLHDVGKSGWMYFIILIPIVGFIWLLVLLCTDSMPESNEWGDNPKQ